MVSRWMGKNNFNWTLYCKNWLKIDSYLSESTRLLDMVKSEVFIFTEGMLDKDSCKHTIYSGSLPEIF